MQVYKEREVYVKEWRKRKRLVMYKPLNRLVKGIFNGSKHLILKCFLSFVNTKLVKCSDVKAT